MKYKVGDKVRHDGGDWWLYGTVSAVFEHPICPCYRLNVERMEKKNCKFSITQFEFELESWNEESGRSKDNRKWENLEIEYLKKYYGVLNNDDLSKFLQRSPQSIEEKWLQIKPKAEIAAEPKQTVEPKPKPKVEVKAEPEKKVEPKIAVLPQKVKKGVPKAQRGDAWRRNLEDYSKGLRSNVISAWASQNRKDYKIGKLAEEKLEKLIEIDFPFDSQKKKRDGYWERCLNDWKKGVRNPNIQQWRQKSIRQFLEGKLVRDRINQLKEVGILK